MTPSQQPDNSFDTLLDEVLRESANAQPSPHFALTLHAALKHERGLAMPPTFAPAPTSILWGTQPRSDANFRGLLGAALAHAAILLLVVYVVAHKAVLLAAPAALNISLIDPPPPLPRALPKATVMGGGGGQKGPTPVTRGTPPKFAAEQLNPPKAPPLNQPKIDVPVTVNVQPDLKMAKSDVPQIGMPNSPLVGMSMGNGRGTGLGSGSGNGIGPGTGGNTGGGLYKIGGGVSAPVATYSPLPEFSEEARKAKVAGSVLVYLQVDENGRPTHVRVARGIGLGLDEKAVEAVRQYKFKPAMKDGHPVAVELAVEVDFKIF